MKRLAALVGLSVFLLACTSQPVARNAPPCGPTTAVECAPAPAVAIAGFAPVFAADVVATPPVVFEGGAHLKMGPLTTDELDALEASGDEQVLIAESVRRGNWWLLLVAVGLALVLSVRRGSIRWGDAELGLGKAVYGLAHSTLGAPLVGGAIAALATLATIMQGGLPLDGLAWQKALMAFSGTAVAVLLKDAKQSPGVAAKQTVEISKL